MDNPMVSIVIPVYNGANYMQEAIDSALAQTYKNCEVIVVNDGSTDNTEEIALSYGNKIRYFAKENGGVASALNLAIGKMNGEYFSWLSHDDIYYSTKVEKQINTLVQNGDMYAPLFGKYVIMTMPGREIKELPPEYRFKKEELGKGVLPVLFGLLHGCAMLIHKSHFDRVGLFDESLLTSQDYDMWFRIFRNQKPIYIDEPLVISRLHEAQGSKTIERFQQNCEEIQIDMVSRLNEDEITCLFETKYQMYYHMMMMAQRCNWNGCIKEWMPQFLNEEEPRIVDGLQNLRENANVVLYCAGRNGRRLQRELWLYGIRVTAFCDNNKELWGTEINDIKCIAPKDVSKDAQIIVTKDYPEDMVAELKEAGYEKVIGYDSIVRELYKSVPLKENVEKYF